MSILHRLVRKTLALNRMRTWVTIIGITLSMALFVAVLEGAYSGLMFMLNVEGNTDGYYQGYYYGLDKETAKQAAAQRGIKRSTVWELVGYEAAEDLEADRRPICVDALGDDPDGLVSVTMLEGRLPQTDGELVLPSDYFSAGDLTRKEIREAASDAIGKTLTLPLGTREDADGNPLDETEPYRGEDERIVNVTERTYTIVGVYYDFDRYIEGDRTFYRALTVGEGVGEYRVFFTLRMPTFFKQFREHQTVSKNLIVHSSILRYYGASDNTLIIALYGLAGVLVGLVAFGSISLIYNAFSISVAERTRQFGILKSVGATKKQIRAMVRYEAVTLAGIGILLGAVIGLAGIGITLWGISPILTRMLTAESIQTGATMKLIVSPAMLVLSALVCLLTTLISAHIPAVRAVRKNAIEAIRQSGDVKVSAREVKVSPLTLRLFGFEGMMASKSFKRNRKRYRATVLSLFLSIVLFVSASSLTSYLQDSVDAAIGDSNQVDLALYTYDNVDADTLQSILRDADAVTQETYCTGTPLTMTYRTDDLSASFRSLYGVDATWTEYTMDRSVQFVDDEAFCIIAKDSGFQPEEFLTGDPKGLLVSQSTERVQKDGKTVYKTVDLIDAGSFPVQITAKDERLNETEGWIVFAKDGILPDQALEKLGVKEGEIVMYDESAYAVLNRPDPNGNSALGNALLVYDQTGEFDVSVLDPEMLRVVPESAIYNTYSLTVAGACTVNVPIIVSDGSILYPYSRLHDVLNTESTDKMKELIFCFRTNDHIAANASLVEIAEETGLRAYMIQDVAESFEMERLLVLIVNIFAYGFIILISLIAVANVFNTISTNILLRRREFAMLKSIGLSEKGFGRMLRYECVIYGLKGLLWGLPAAVLVTFLIWNIASEAVEQAFYIPWYSVVIAVGSVFLVVFATMLYARHKLSKDNPIDALKNENL